MKAPPRRCYDRGHARCPRGGAEVTQRICSVEGCDRPFAARGFCHKHYHRYRRELPLDATTEQIKRRKVFASCKAEGCDKIVQARGWCKLHYRQWWLPQYRASHPEQVRGWKLGRYGITKADFDSLMLAQGGLCPICRDPLTAPHVDHDHRTGAVRGILCMSCNVALGHLGDDVGRVSRAVEYLSQ